MQQKADKLFLTFFSRPQCTIHGGFLKGENEEGKEAF
jgi:hypothetical protein